MERPESNGNDGLHAHIVTTIQALVRPGDVFEVRGLKVPQRYGNPATVSGYYDFEHISEAAAAALELSDKRRARGVYITLNKVKPELLAQRRYRLDVVKTGETTSDEHIERRQWLLIDVDPKRAADISSSDQEKAKALSVMRAVREHLDMLGWPAPVVGDSGNGYHLLYPIDLPADDGGLVKRVLLALSQIFDSEDSEEVKIKIDTTVHNPSRISKLYGTMARKGDDAPDLGRPHRRAKLMEVPNA
jgi:hypothetical protein